VDRVAPVIRDESAAGHGKVADDSFDANSKSEQTFAQRSFTHSIVLSHCFCPPTVLFEAQFLLTIGSTVWTN